MTAENISEGTTIHTESQSNGYGTIMRQPGLADEDDDDESSVYTELLQGSVPCPTCRGLGNVPKGLRQTFFFKLYQGSSAFNLLCQ